MKEFEKQVLASYRYHDADDISTERLLQMVADDCKCDVSDVVTVLAKHERRKGMSEVTQEQIDKALKECIWKRNCAGIDVCAGDIAPCERLIELRKCDTLRKLFEDVGQT